MPVVLRGPAHSTLLRAARLALEEKGVAYDSHHSDRNQPPVPKQSSRAFR